MTSGTRELREFIKALGGMDKDLRDELRPRLKHIGEQALASVRARASWSSRIPGATRLSVKFGKSTAGVSITVNRKKAPHGRPYEHDGRPGTFRHPVFADASVPRRQWTWREQTARPFLVPGAEPYFEQVDEEIAHVVDEVARRLGFR